MYLPLLVNIVYNFKHIPFAFILIQTPLHKQTKKPLAVYYCRESGVDVGYNYYN